MLSMSLGHTNMKFFEEKKMHQQECGANTFIDDHFHTDKINELKSL